MNSASIRGSIVFLRSGVLAVANLVPRSYCQSLRNANSVQRSCYSTFRSFRSSKSCGCLVETNRYQAFETGSGPAAMSGKGKNKKKSKKQKQSQNTTPNTEKTNPEKSESPNVQSGSLESKPQSSNGQNQIEVAQPDESKERGAVSKVQLTKTDDKSKSPVFGGALAIENERKLEKTDDNEGVSPLKPTVSKEEVAKSDTEREETVTLNSSTNVEVEEDKERDEVLKQSQDKTVDHQASQPSGKTEGERKSSIGNKESNQIKDDESAPTFGNPPSALANSSEVNKDTPSKTGSTGASSQGQVLRKQGNLFGDKPRQEYHGTRNSAIMKERDRFLAMAPKDKRKYYARKSVLTLDDIDTWKDYYSENHLSLKTIRPQDAHMKNLFKGDFPHRDADDELNSKVSIYEGDITLLEIDGIVNAANSTLLGGGGVDGSIHRAAGSQLQEECRILSGCKTGDAKTTAGYKLPAKYVIHTVGPQGNYPNELRSCYNRCLDEMLKHNMRSIAFCCISTGIYGYPNELAVHVALTAVREWLCKLKQNNQLDLVDRVIFCLFLPVDINQYQQWMQIYFPMHGVNGADKGAPDKARNSNVPSASDCPAKEGEGEDKLQSSASVESTLPDKEGKDEEGLKSSTSGQEVASMEVEDVVEEDMDADDGSPGSSQVGGTVSPDKKCKLDPATGKVAML